MILGIPVKDLDLHGHVPGTPDGGAQVADGDTVAHAMDVRALAAHGSGNKADAVDDIVILHLGDLAVLAADDNSLVLDLGDGALSSAS